MYRVLKSGGNSLIADMNRRASNQQIEDYLKSIEAKGMYVRTYSIIGIYLTIVELELSALNFQY
jgi:ubiquinone/menaquinone biosynthesis C-methylase UbiE